MVTSQVEGDGEELSFDETPVPRWAPAEGATDCGKKEECSGDVSALWRVGTWSSAMSCRLASQEAPMGAAPTSLDGKTIERVGAVHYDGTVGEVRFKVAMEDERGMKWLWRHEICHELPQDVTKRVSKVLMRHYREQEADPVRQYPLEVYPVKAIPRCLLLKEPFIRSGRRKYYFEVDWEGVDDMIRKVDVAGDRGNKQKGAGRWPPKD